MAKAFALILALLLIFGVAACGGKDDAPTDSAQSMESKEESMKTDEASADGITNVEIGGHALSEFTILYTNQKYGEYAEILSSLLEAETGTKLAVKPFEAGFSSPRIIVGLPESAEWIAPCDPDRTLSLTEESLTHVIEQKDGVLVLAGASEWTVHDAVCDFVDKYLKGKTGEVKIGDVSGSFKDTAAYEGDADADIRVMTLNTYATNGNYAKRFPYMTALLKKYLPDVIGMQEVNNRVYDSVIAALPHSYAVAQDYIDGSDDKSYTPIVYRKDKYKLLETSVRFLRKRYEKTNTKTISYAIFERLDNGEKFGIINMHGAIILESYNLEETNKVEGAEWRTDNVKQMLELAEEIREKYAELPLIFTGDFNCNKKSEAYKTAINGGLSDAEFDADEVRITGIKTHHDVGVYPDEGNSIDHIFYTSNVKALRHDILTEQFCLNATDHCPVYADFVFGGEA